MKQSSELKMKACYLHVPGIQVTTSPKHTQASKHTHTCVQKHMHKKARQLWLIRQAVG